MTYPGLAVCQVCRGRRLAGQIRHSLQVRCYKALHEFICFRPFVGINTSGVNCLRRRTFELKLHRYGHRNDDDPHGEANPEREFFELFLVQDDPHRHTLDDFNPVTRTFVGR